MVLITGATGNLGGEVTRRYFGSEEPLRLLTRSPDNLKVFESHGAEVVHGDFCDPVSLEKAVKGTDKVVASVHSMLGRGKYSSKNIDLKGHINLIDIAKKEGVKHFIYISIAGASEDHPIDFWRYKYRVEEYLKASGIDFTIIRPTAFMETHAHMLLGQHVIEKGQVTLFGEGENPRNFVAAEDVARFVLMALEHPSLIGKIVEVGGLENYSSKQVVHLYSDLIGKKPKIKYLPLFVLRLMSATLRPFHSGISRMMRAAVHAETADLTFNGEQLVEKYGVEPVGLRDWVLNNAIPATAGSRLTQNGN